MNEWTDEAWNEFIAAHAAEIATGFRRQDAVLALMKKAWVHGARAAHAKCVEVMHEAFRKDEPA